MANINNTTDIKAPTPANPAGEATSPADEVREQAAGNDAQMPVEPSKLDNLRGMMSQRYPDQDFSQDDNIYAKVADDYAAHDKEIGEYKEREGRIANLFTRDPRSAQFMSDWVDGGDPEIAMIRRHGLDDFKAALDDPDKQEEIAAANQEFIDRMAKENELEEEYKNNLAESLDNIDKYQQEKGLSDEQVDKAMTYLTASAHNIIMGKFTPELIEAAIKAQNYDSDMATREREAEVRGRNTAVEAKLRKPQQTDGMPQLGSRNTGGRGQHTPNIPGALGREKKSIWEQGGGIKRTTR